MRDDLEAFHAARREAVRLGFRGLDLAVDVLFEAFQIFEAHIDGAAFGGVVEDFVRGVADQRFDFGRRAVEREVEGAKEFHGFRGGGGGDCLT